MVLHHVVSTKELVLLLDGKAISNEVVTEKRIGGGVRQVFHYRQEQEADGASQQTN